MPKQMPGRMFSSLGILLGWLLTGECNRELILPRIANRRLGRIVEKCTAFAPKDRYPTATKVRADLLALDGRRQRRAIMWSCAILACLLCLCAGFGLGRYAERTGVLRAPGAVSFREPLVEQAVRLTLGLGEGEIVQESDLLSVTELFICGDQALADGESYNALCRQVASKDLPWKNGGITSLSDLARLKNLTTLSLAFQDITDLKPLQGLTSPAKRGPSTQSGFGSHAPGLPALFVGGMPVWHPCIGPVPPGRMSAAVAYRRGKKLCDHPPNLSQNTRAQEPAPV